ncbi:MAG: peptide chain release factor N(5)-glutamine methyltransferase [Candidatus Binataceae bacterium]
MNPDAIAEPHTPERAVAAAIAAASARLARAGVASARLDAELLMAAAAGISRAAVIAGAAGMAGAKQIDAALLARFERMVARREAREPLAYIVGQREFFSLEFAVSPGVLVPRPETETLVEAALDFLDGRSSATVLDIGTGSGAIAIAIAKNAPAARIVALDISKVSLENAADNARRHLCADRITLVQGDCFPPIDGDGSPFHLFDLIVSNPPYIAEAAFATLAPEVRDFEPRIALEGGRDGMDFYRKIAGGLARWLMRGSEVILEVGAGQAGAVEAMMHAAGCAARARMRDLAGVERVVRSRRAL